MKNLYQVLGIPSTATPEAIKAAYRELSKRWHPDRPNGSEARFKSIVAAYEILGEAVSRSRWDARRTRWLLDRNAVDCSQCWTPNRFWLHGFQMKCGKCQAPINEPTLAGRVAIAATRYLYSAEAGSEGVVNAVVDKSALRNMDFSTRIKDRLLSKSK